MNYVRKYQIIRFFYFIVPSAELRTRLLKKNGYFFSMGENVHFQPRKLPADPKFIKIGNNVSVASDVDFTTHDIIHNVINHLPNFLRGGQKLIWAVLRYVTMFSLGQEL